MAGMTWRTVTISEDGMIHGLPSKMHAETGDGIAWFIQNDSQDRVKVRIKDFHRKSNGAPIAAVTFIQDKCTVDPGDLPGIIVGQVTFKPGGGAGSTTLTKYTIEVVGPAGKDYDPDLEIERPLA